ncbi:serine hydrolase domain-containing protein [Arthrobacter crusticola]|uniref:serine hydrolase domain-containing protein n=1 Tax=Arthrobacter crusticola TaxID=2547960 RepID=UPI001FEB7CA8|nr:serine hydrolase [Arthrobacter crusticola]
MSADGVHVRVGEDSAQRRWRSDDRENIYSVSKGVCSLAIGMAVDEGILTMDTRVPDLLPRMELGSGVDRVAVGHLRSMSSGIDFAWFGGEPAPWPDLAQEMLRRPAQDPGAVFQYSDASTYVAMRMLGAAVGDVHDWLMPRLFDPLGIHNPQRHRCPQGWIIGGSGLELRNEELARIGQLLRDRGRWNNRQLLDPAWIDRMHSSWIHTNSPAPFERYGLAAWAGPGACWRLDGRYGQYVIVDEAHNAVVTMTAHEESRDHRLAELAVQALTGEGTKSR